MASDKEVRQMALIKVKRNFQITIPNSLRKGLNLAVGDYFEAEKKDDGKLILKPVKMVPLEKTK